jgi:hypothetical protein
MGNCESCLDLLELRFLQRSYTKIPETLQESDQQHKRKDETEERILGDPGYQMIQRRSIKSSKKLP